MHILIGYGYYPYTTGTYFEKNLAADHQVTFVGTARSDRAGYPPDVDIAELAAQLKPTPDLFLYIHSGHLSYLPRNLHRLPCPTCAYLIDVHLGSRLRQPLAACFDYVFVAQRDYLPQYRAFPTQYTAWLPLAYEPADDVTTPERVIDVGVVGNVSPNAQDARARLLNTLQNRYQMNDFRKRYLPHQMAQLYRQSKIVFNHAIRDDVNMRVFEAMGNGALLVTNRIGNGLLDLFEDGKHLVTYETADELVHHIDHYLAHDEERRQIAATGARLAQEKHTYRHRVDEILDTIFTRHPNAQGPLRSAGEAEAARHFVQLYSAFRLLDATMTEWTHLRRLRAHRIEATGELIKAILRRVRYG